jgi:hypothetical protein
MTEEQPEKPDDSHAAETESANRVVIVGPDGQPVASVPASALRPPEGGDSGDSSDSDESDLTSLVEQPAKVMRIGSMIRQLLEEVK